MKRVLFILITTGLAAVALQHAFAQKATKKEPVKTAGGKLPVATQMIDVTLAHYAITNGRISKSLFDSLAKAGLKIAPGAPANAVIDGFAFTYAEHSMYEDSVGNPLPVTEYLIEYCYGDTLTNNIRSSLFDRTKPGDTVYFDQIKIDLPSGKPAKGKALKFTIGQ